MFKKVLIANRGEIAVRIERTLQRLGVASVAVYSEADRHARHVLEADEAVCVGPPPAAESYLNVPAILAAIERTGAEAVHPGYGFLSENAAFAETIERRGVAFVGPTPDQIRGFGTKHGARSIATELGVSLLPGTGLLASSSEAKLQAERIGFPVILKSTAGGGGIGMQLCRDSTRLVEQFESVQSLAQKNFGDGGVFLERYVERARHVEVQIFGDGRGRVVALGERDCSAQRRHQKVIEETPAPRLRPAIRQALLDAAVKLGSAVGYRSAGTVEFVYDDAQEAFYFLEVNTRLQVEHPVTEAVTGLDLVEWMLRVAAGEGLPSGPFAANGHAIEVRLYAEDPKRGFRPSAGLLTEAAFPADVRVDGWVERGTTVPAFYDPMIAKVIAHAPTRDEALAKLGRALADTELGGIETNLEYLRALVASEVVREGAVTTSTLGSFEFASHTLEVLVPGTLTTVQDYPGRLGYWDIGVPPSGPMDALHFRLANRAVGNPEGAAALELTVSGPTLKFACDAVIALAGAHMTATLDGEPVRYHRPIAVRAGQTLAVGKVSGPGCRAYLAVRHGIDLPEYLGSRATFTLGGFGGHGGRALRKGDVLHLATSGPTDGEPAALEPGLLPELSDEWTIGVLYGPHGAPDFFTPSDIETFFATAWEVHYNSARTGVRLIGPKPTWARPDGGEAGLHPSNIHDNAYAVGTVDFTGDMPIILGPDGPSLGGFVCPATVVRAELWKIGQLKPGARVRFVPVALDDAVGRDAAQTAEVATRKAAPRRALEKARVDSAVVRELPADGERPRVVYRPSGDRYLLVEYGPLVLDLALRFRVHALWEWLGRERQRGIVDITPGIRSLQLHYDSAQITLPRLLALLERAESELPAVGEMRVPTRIVRMPLSWDDPQTRLAIEKYMQGVRRDAPWTPSNLEFIRRINGLGDIEAVKRVVFDASYLVLGLGDVYLGAPVATPVDPRHRLVTTKYNPARTWTPENAVGIGGAYLCIYGMEGPGGYQFVGRTLQVYNRFRTTRDFPAGKPWLLRFFDQIRFFPVAAEELLEMREAFPHGRYELEIGEETFGLGDYQRFLAREEKSIAAFKATQHEAFEEERRRWAEQGATLAEADLVAPAAAAAQHAGSELVESHVHGSVWQLRATAGTRVARGDVLLVLESMKMEIAIEAPASGTIVEFLVAEGRAVSPGQALVALRVGDS
ncbi:MAG TPA: urea carboxylase [Polyangiaceae bacterium]|nr:urea carboxylase [Polyangiaceae bacterium]